MSKSGWCGLEGNNVKTRIPLNQSCLEIRISTWASSHVIHRMQGRCHGHITEVDNTRRHCSSLRTIPTPCQLSKENVSFISPSLPPSDLSVSSKHRSNQANHLSNKTKTTGRTEQTHSFLHRSLFSPLPIPSLAVHTIHTYTQSHIRYSTDPLTSTQTRTN